MIKSLTSALTVAFALGVTPLTLAGPDGCDGCQVGGQLAQAEQFVDDDDEAVAKLESQLNEILLVDEGGRILMKQEFRAMLPENVPVERVEAMLGSLVELDSSGSFRFRNPEMMRPYLPMLRNFLEQGGLERLRDLKDLSPAEREEALRRMMEEGGSPEAQPEPRYNAPAPQSNNNPLERRLREMEERVAKLEGLLREREGGQDGQRRGLFGRGGGSDPLARMGETGRRMRVWRNGLRKLGEIMTPEDMQRLRAMIERMRSDMQPGDLQNRDELMRKLQQGMDPQDLGRAMEIFSSFIATEAGRAFVAELEHTVERLEAFVNSPQGDQLGKAFEQLQGRLGNGEGGNNLLKRLEGLIQGRDRRGAQEAQPEHRQPRARRHRDESEQQVQPPSGSKLY